jgi:hypothetical protein
MSQRNGDVPNRFICPIIQEIMKEPVILPDVHRDERPAIAEALQWDHCFADRALMSENGASRYSTTQ